MLASCTPRPAPLVPAALAPVDREAAVAWARATTPVQPTAIRFRWRYRDERLSAVGRGTARIAPPDSMRFDFAATLNLASGAAVVVGDSVLWAEPARDFRSLVPAIPLLWAALGVARPPAPGAEVFGRSDPPRTVWRFVGAGDTLDYVASDGPETPLLEAEWRREGAVVARGRTRLNGRRWPASARIDFPEASARFELTVVAVDTAAVIAPALWRGRR
ncbi:MAG: hypothetical protein ACREMR_04110 [Gemmatimonadales bacterium]